jgi:hypothetical protein
MPYTLVALPQDEPMVAKSARCYLKFLQALMSKLLRKVDHKLFWNPNGEFATYVPADEAPADALKDLRTEHDALSVWQIDDNEANLDRVLAAIASSRDYLLKLDFLIFDSKHIEELGLKMEREDGRTYDSKANSDWHFDLIHLSASDLSRLANKMFKYSKRGRLTVPKLTQLVKESVGKGYVDPAHLHPEVRATVLNGKA